jgi:hypothetical protein
LRDALSIRQHLSTNLLDTHDASDGISHAHRLAPFSHFRGRLDAKHLGCFAFVGYVASTGASVNSWLQLRSDAAILRSIPQEAAALEHLSTCNAVDQPGIKQKVTVKNGDPFDHVWSYSSLCTTIMMVRKYCSQSIVFRSY